MCFILYIIISPSVIFVPSAYFEEFLILTFFWFEGHFIPKTEPNIWLSLYVPSYEEMFKNVDSKMDFLRDLLFQTNKSVKNL